jgi:hypothetical protein
MIKIENIEVYGWKAAIRGMRNPLNSWDKSDSVKDVDTGRIAIGGNDLALMKKLCRAGTDHRKFMRMINVTCDITAPMYWWKEFDTYKVGTVRNSCSTMHTVTNKPFTLDDFSCENLNPMVIDGCLHSGCKLVLIKLIDVLNGVRSDYVRTNNKFYWWQIIQLLPSSYNQRATVQLNYEVLANMYHSRKAHKLDEWREFCKWVESLPHSELITGDSNAD